MNMATELQLVAAGEDSDDDSGIDSLAGSDTETLASWISKYREENGRTYHAFKDGKYWGPNDEQAKEHLDISHHLFTLTLEGKLYLAPISPNTSNVLDIGTGTGIWAIDFAETHPASVVTGTDLSPIQPTWVPPNVKFEIDDCESEWLYPDEWFDYIHIRSLFGCVKNWHRLYAQALRCLKPGGYLEHSEFSPGTQLNCGGGPAHNEAGNFGKEAIECGQITGRSFDTVYHICDWMRQAGYEDVTERQYEWPLGTWPKDKKLKALGFWARAHADAGLENWCLAMLTRVLGWSYEEVQVYIAMARQKLWDRKRHAWHEMRVVYGAKPLRAVAFDD